MIRKIGREFQHKRTPANFVTLDCCVPGSNVTGDCGFAAAAAQSKATAIVNVAGIIATAEYYFVIAV